MILCVDRWRHDALQDPATAQKVEGLGVSCQQGRDRRGFPDQKKTQLIVKSFGDFDSLALVDRSEADGTRSYRYRLEFKKATLLQRFVFDQEKKLAASVTEDVASKPGAGVGVN